MLMAQTNAYVASVACENIYVKMPKPSVDRPGEPCIKMKYTRVAAVVGKRMKPKESQTTTQSAQLVNLNDPRRTTWLQSTKEPTNCSLTVTMRHLK